jgi:hypothetical protein
VNTFPTTGFLVVVFVASNVAIALAYLVLGFYVSPRFNIVGVPWGVKVTKYAMLAFFLFCAITHLEQIIHVLAEPDAQDFLLSWHMVVTHFLQAIAAPLAAWFTAKYLLVSIRPLNEPSVNVEP